jgi:L-asparaginase/Glu-tRNA(Gln) amidotransferase subunit D
VRIGDQLLMDKEALGLVISGVGSRNVPRPRWATVGRVCSPRKLVIGALDRVMEQTWGLHGPNFFKEIGHNRFVVCFNS